MRKWRLWDGNQIQALLHRYPGVWQAFPGFLTAAVSATPTRVRWSPSAWRDCVDQSPDRLKVAGHRELAVIDCR
ncbi:hypothetical protein, partial [Nonomuraea sp. NPDC046570]|uniref:hypothetical protein n=1 Tax=Nonomuraea sp. NPDC046570 TaxID=3155255 RepID=UPI0033E102B0